MAGTYWVDFGYPGGGCAGLPADPPITHPVIGGRTEIFDGLHVRFGKIALVAVPAVTGILFMQSDHDTIPGHLGDNGAGGNGKAFIVPLDDGFPGLSDRLHAHIAVDENIIDLPFITHFFLQCGQGPGHSLLGGL